MASSMDLSGQALLRRIIDAPRRQVRVVICEDFIRVGDTMRTAIEVRSEGRIRLEVPEFEWPRRDSHCVGERRSASVMPGEDSHEAPQ